MQHCQLVSLQQLEKELGIVIVVTFELSNKKLFAKGEKKEVCVWGGGGLHSQWASRWAGECKLLPHPLTPEAGTQRTGK